MSNAQVKTSAVKSKTPRKRPLTSYNIYYRFKRSRIISSGKADKESILKLIAVAPGFEDISPDDFVKLNPKDAFAIRRGIVRKEMLGNLLPFEGRRPHRKRHGMMSFIEMSRAMCDHWKAVDERTKGIFHELAEEGKKLHRERLVACKAKNTGSHDTFPAHRSPPNLINDHTSKSTHETNPSPLYIDKGGRTPCVPCSPVPSNGKVNVASPINIVTPDPAYYMGAGKLNIVSPVGPPPFYQPRLQMNRGFVKEEVYEQEDEFCSFIDQNINLVNDDDMNIAFDHNDTKGMTLTDLINMDEVIDHCTLPLL
jgi:hypothetical protein